MKTPFSLFINSPDGHSYSVPVTEGMLVSELRALVDERTLPPQTPWRLTSASRLLDDNQTLEFYRLGHGNTITISGQIRGGGGPNSSKGGCWAHAQWQDDTGHQRQWTDPAGARTQWLRWDSWNLWNWGSATNDWRGTVRHSMMKVSIEP